MAVIWNDIPPVCCLVLMTRQFGRRESKNIQSAVRSISIGKKKIGNGQPRSISQVDILLFYIHWQIPLKSINRCLLNTISYHRKHATSNENMINAYLVWTNHCPNA